MSRLLFDSDNIADLPRDEMCATYSDLIPDKATLVKLRAEFPRGLHLIDRHGDPTGQASIIDVENGLHSPDDAPGWYDKQHAAGIKFLSVYNDRSHIDAVNAAMGKRTFYHWIARLDGTVVVPGFKAGHAPALVQCFNEAELGFHCDGSVVWHDAWNAVPDTWVGTTNLLASLRTIAADLNDAIMIVKRHS